MNNKLPLTSLARLLAVLAACAGLALTPAVAAQATDAQLHSCLHKLKTSSSFQSIRGDVFDRHTEDLEVDPSVLEALNRQPEFTIPVWDYLATLVDEERIQDGRAALAQWQDVLDRIARESGVPAHVIVAVWGVESNFGRNLGQKPLIRSLATLSCFDRRQSYFRGELAAALRILQEGHISPDKLTGSWAGAFGQTQFMPSTFFESAVDFDGDGRRDIVDSVPDALASTARFLKNAGWRSGQAWGLEVSLPAGTSTAGAGRKNKRSMDSWAQDGLRQVDGQALPTVPTPAGLLVPAEGGPAFLTGHNFDVIYRYNASENYALAIALLSDLIAQPQRQTVIQTPWPTDDPGLSRAENRRVQTLLLMRGHDIGEVDGIMGSKTRQAVRTEQEALGMKADGRAGKKLLQALQN